MPLVNTVHKERTVAELNTGTMCEHLNSSNIRKILDETGKINYCFSH